MLTTTMNASGLPTADSPDTGTASARGRDHSRPHLHFSITPRHPARGPTREARPVGGRNGSLRRPSGPANDERKDAQHTHNERRFHRNRPNAHRFRGTSAGLRHPDERGE